MLIIPSDKQSLAYIREIAAQLKSQGETVPGKSDSDLMPSLAIPQPDTFPQLSLPLSTSFGWNVSSPVYNNVTTWIMCLIGSMQPGDKKQALNL